MITDEFLPQPFRFLNQIVRQIVEDSIDQAIVREISLTKIKRLRIPRDIVYLPLSIEDRNKTQQLEQQNNNENNNNLETTITGDNNNTNNNNKPASRQQKTQNTLNTTNTTTGAASKGAAASGNDKNSNNNLFDSFFASPQVVSATGPAGATLVINRSTGRFVATDAAFPDDDEDEVQHEREQQQQISSSGAAVAVAGTVGDISFISVNNNNNNNPSSEKSSSSAHVNPFGNIIGSLPFAPGEEVSCCCISSSGAVAIATVMVRSVISAYNNNNSNTDQTQQQQQLSPPGSPPMSAPHSISNTPIPGQQQQSNATTTTGVIVGGDQQNNTEKDSQQNQQQQPPTSLYPLTSSNCGRLFIYNSVAPSHQVQLARSGIPAIRRTGLSKLLSRTVNNNNQPDQCVFLPPNFIPGSIEISPDEEFVSVAAASSSHFSPQAANFLFSNSATTIIPKVLLYRKIQPQDAFSREANISTSPTSNNNTTNTTTTNNNTSATTLAKNIAIPTTCETTLVFLGSISPPSFATAQGTSSVSSCSVTPISHFLFRPVESRYVFTTTNSSSRNTFPMVCHTLFVAWRGYNCFTTIPLYNSIEFGGVETMRGSAIDYHTYATISINNSISSITPIVQPNPNATVAGKNNNNNATLKPQFITISSNNNNNKNNANDDGEGNKNQTSNVVVTPPLPPLIPLKSFIYNSCYVEEYLNVFLSSTETGNANVNGVVDGDATEQHQQKKYSSNPQIIQHHPLPQLVTASTQCLRTSKVAIGMSEGVVGVWTQDSPSSASPGSFSTIAVVSPHRSDAVINPSRNAAGKRRPMITTSLSFFRNTHIVAALAVPVQLKSVGDDLPSVHYSKVVVIELKSGKITASVPHVPRLSFASTIGDKLPLILLFGGNRTFWVANIYTGEIVAEISGAFLSTASTPNIISGLSIPESVSGDTLIGFCNSVNGNISVCPITGTLYGLFNSNTKSSSSTSTTTTFLRIDGVSIAANLRPMLPKRDDVVRARRNLNQISSLLDSVLLPNQVQVQVRNQSGKTRTTKLTESTLGSNFVPAPPTTSSSSIGITLQQNIIGTSQVSQRGGGGVTTQSNVTTGFNNNNNTNFNIIPAPINELVSIPTRDISRKVLFGNSNKAVVAERAKKVNKLLDDLLASATSGNSVIGK